VRVAQILFSQGFGNRRECAALLAAGEVRLGPRVLHDPDEDLATTGLVLTVQDVDWPFHEPALVMLHKPAGHECSTRPGRWPSVLSLLPPPLRRRGVQPVGRLDADTTGLLLLTDDGALAHRLTSPKHHVAKVYEVTTKHAVDDALLVRLREGVVLRDDPQPVRAAAVSRTGVHTLALTLSQGRYHQVKRMVAAAGNRVEALHRSAFGPWSLPSTLVPGQWQWLNDQAAPRSEPAG
jgi:16S rRNA pseudouridine516 synthase